MKNKLHRLTKIWVVDDDDSMRFVLTRAFEKHGFEVQSFDVAQNVLHALEESEPDVLVSDVRMPGMTGMDLLSIMRDKYAHIPVIITTAHSDLDSAVCAYEGGAFDYLPKPFDIDEAIALVERAMGTLSQEAAPVLSDSKNSNTIIGEAPAMQELFRAIGRLSRSNITVLINGESGTGKELVANALHRHSPRAQQPFVALNMAAIPKDLMEAELFGHEKGAFTGASQLRKGRFEQANGGTLFLDEIGDMPAELQTRLLRVLADGQFYRVGGVQSVQVDVRIIAATHQNLEQLVTQGRFREDLFHRLNVIRLQLPALKDRKEDIPLLLEYFLQRVAKELGEPCKVLSDEALVCMQNYAWPGNVRELENVCRWLTVMAASPQIYVADLPPELTAPAELVSQSPVKDSSQVDEQSVNTQVADNSGWIGELRTWAQAHAQQSATPLADVATPLFEKALIDVALACSKGHKQEAAKILGWGRNTLTRKLKELNEPN